MRKETKTQANARRRARIVRETIAERRRQDRQWGGPKHDDTHDGDAFGFLIGQRASYLQEFPRDSSNRKKAIQAAALAIAYVESIDRKAAK